MNRDLLFGERNVGAEDHSESRTRILGQLIPSVVLGIVMIFILVVAGTWPGITDTSATIPALVLLALLVVSWLLLRTKYKNQWYRTPLDLAVPLWLIAFAISTVANLPARQYVVVGLWFAGLYILLWYITYDVLGNKLLLANGLLDSLFVAGVVVVGTAVFQILTNQPDRVAGLLQNANILAAFLALMIPLTFSRILNTKGYMRVGYVIFMLLSIFVLLLTGGRGGVLGVCCSFGAMLFFRVGPSQRLAIILGILVLGFYLIAYRGGDGRYPIYRRAFALLPSKIMTGQGLFTFRTTRFPPRYKVYTPPDGQNLHAHDIVLQIAVELGIVGVLALGVTATQFIRYIPEKGPERWAMAAVFGLLVQQLADFTVMTPSIAICTILVLCVATVNIRPRASNVRWPMWLLTALAVILLVVGFAVRYVPRNLL